MTEIGRMIWKDGFSEGKESYLNELREEGRRLGKLEVLNIQLMKKFKKIPAHYEEKINNLSEIAIEVIALEIFDIETLQDLEEYL
ncbi:DUF4351 domain-containing protein [Clostridium manihotivorum]|uniref:DUF4351 domain-containing protein n=1 Tax=Clostridium manihotivorum TaxID=2320868 RepID=A0A3R5X3F7_9CLOT|nr:DUF4351 domain-containing protein [Clostridium manihotivorum]QAA33535.1 hypothetical protein C1I91_18850 [Clostridium manihotivorum]